MVLGEVLAMVLIDLVGSESRKHRSVSSCSFDVQLVRG